MATKFGFRYEHNGTEYLLHCDPMPMADGKFGSQVAVISGHDGASLIERLFPALDYFSTEAEAVDHAKALGYQLDSRPWLIERFRETRGLLPTQVGLLRRYRVFSCTLSHSIQTVLLRLTSVGRRLGRYAPLLTHTRQEKRMSHWSQSPHLKSKRTGLT